MAMNPSPNLDDHRAALTEACTHAGADERACRLALDQARAEQAVEAALRQRLEAEENATNAARRKEQALADLAAASAARAKREAEIDASIKARLAAEQAALAAARERVLSEQAAETLALARTAAEEEVARVAAQRLVAEREALSAAAARQLAEEEAQAAGLRRTALEAELAEVAAAAPSPLPAPVPVARPPFAVPGRLALFAAACFVAGVLAGHHWFSGKPAAEVQQLKLDTRLSLPATHADPQRR